MSVLGKKRWEGIDTKERAAIGRRRILKWAISELRASGASIDLPNAVAEELGLIKMATVVAGKQEVC